MFKIRTQMTLMALIYLIFLKNQADQAYLRMTGGHNLRSIIELRLNSKGNENE